MSPARRPVVWLALGVAVFAVRLLASITGHSLTADEPHYVGKGAYLWKSGDYDWSRTLTYQPPLAYHVASLPLLAVDRSGVTSANDVGRQLVASSVISRDALRVASRLPFALVACWGAVLLFLWAREAAGPVAGLLAAGFYTLSPMLLAHGSIAHSDLLVSVLYAQTLYAFWRWRRRPGAARLLLCGVSLGLALLAKYSALLLLPTLALLFLWEWLAPDGEPAGETFGRRFARLTADGVGLLAAATATILLGYGASLDAASQWLGPFGWYLDIHESGRRVFFLGEFADEWPGWLFFPIAFAIKTPIGLLVWIGLAFASLRRTPSPLGRHLALPALFFLAVVFFWLNVPTGLRYLLPLYPLVALFVGTQLASLPRGPLRGVAFAAGAWALAAGLWIHPHYLTYFNEAVGGPQQGHRYLLDSNLDWGQDLPALADWLHERGDPPIRIAWFGAERPADYGIRAQHLVDCHPVGGLVVVSANVREGLYAAPNVFAPPVPGCWDWLDAHEPVARPGGSLFVYDLPMTAVPQDR
ncbi:MAG: ArnT family glycosyltransferase [Myxococcota bacterium]